ncbi:hypothetical protein [Cohnella laeviribosi]|uniref:hypothetical protein n=1 Tax=Cohnella laeviribosi TaxID=380174 RepID=UPI0024814219|nr:hypothetical protein [Cohnella laeviribosi]
MEPPRTLQWHNGHDHLGWHRERDGTSFLGLFIPYGRIKDTENMQLKSVLRDLVLELRPTVRFTAQQNVILSGIPDELRPAVEERLRSAGVPLPQELSTVRQNTMACVALPTCGLALAESERFALCWKRSPMSGNKARTSAAIGAALAWNGSEAPGTHNGSANHA